MIRRDMTGTFLMVLTLLWCVGSAGARGSEGTPAGVRVAQADENSNQSSGQEAEKARETGEQPPPASPLPPPEPKSIIATEKPIEGGLKLREPVAKVTDTTEKTVTEEPAATLPAVEPQTAPSPPTQSAPPPENLPENVRIMEEMSIYNVPTGNFRTMKCIIDEEYNLRSIVYGEELGYLHILNADPAGNFREVWKSPPLNGAIRGVFVDDLDDDGKTEIVAYTSNGDFFIYGYDDHALKYKTPDGMYIHINCMVVANMDNSPELELLFVGVKPGDRQPDGSVPAGNLIQFDPLSHFEEWISQEKYIATDMIIGNVDNDQEYEIILNTGEILDYRFKSIKWKSADPFGNRLYLIDIDNDGVLELVTEYEQSYIRIFDIDQRREKW